MSNEYQKAITGNDSIDQDRTTQDTGSNIDQDGIIENTGSEFDIDSLTADEIEKIDLSEFEVDEEENLKAKEEDNSTEEEDESTEKIKEEGKTGDPLKDTKAALTREQQRRAELEKKLAELEEKLRQLENPGEFDELTEEELEELKYDDPDAYVRYMLDKENHEKKKQEYESQMQQVIFDRQAKEIMQFAHEIGVDVDNEEELQKFLTSDNLKSLDQFVMNNMKPNEGGIFTKDQLIFVWKALNFDNEIEKRVKNIENEIINKTTQKTINQIERAKNGGSVLDKVGRSDSTPPKEFNQMTQEEIDQLTDEEVDQYLRELEQKAFSVS